MNFVFHWLDARSSGGEDIGTMGTDDVSPLAWMWRKIWSSSRTRFWPWWLSQMGVFLITNIGIGCRGAEEEKGKSGRSDAKDVSVRVRGRERAD